MPLRLVPIVAGWVALAVLAPAGTARADAPSPEEQLLLEMVNRARAYPEAELEVLVNLADGLPVTFDFPRSDDPFIAHALDSHQVDAAVLVNQWQLLQPAPPLAWNSNLNDSATLYSQIMIQTNLQEHNLDEHVDNQGNADLYARFEASGFVFFGSLQDAAAENLFAQAETVLHAHGAFMIDWGPGSSSGIQEPPAHRNVAMHPFLHEVGFGIAEHDGGEEEFGPLVVTQHFARRLGAGPFLTGVAIDDQDGDQFYSIGEGLGGVTIVATRQTDQQQFSTTTWDAGGYTLAIETGTYDVVASGGLLPVPVAMGDVNVDGNNVKVDFITSLERIPGDVNGDGRVDRADAATLLRHLGVASGAAIDDGDLNDDGRVDLSDLARLAANINTSPSASPVAVPEPATLSLLIAATGLFVGRGTRRRR